MSKTILLIENDAAFAGEISGALEAMDFTVRVTGDGKDGLDLARELKPDAIVLCVELPKLSGYSICNKIKKDEALKGIPLILTSSEATEEVFEDHKKLKVRAEEYLVKPYVPAALLGKLSVLLGLPAGEAESTATGHDELVGEEEVVSLEEELGLEAFAAEPEENLPALDLDSLPDEPAAAPAGGGGLDDDLKLLDDAFDGLSTPSELPAAPTAARSDAHPTATSTLPAAEIQAADEAIEKALGVDRPVTSEDLEAASASLPDEDETMARADLGGVADEADLALGALTELPGEAEPSAFDALEAFDALDEPAPTPASPASSSPAAATAADPVGIGLAAAGAAAAIGLAAVAAGAAGSVAAAPSAASLAELARLEAELAETRAAVTARETEAGELRSKLEAAVHRSEGAESALGEQEAEVASLKARADALAGQAKKADAEAKTAREDSRRAAEQVREASERADAAEAKMTAAEAKAGAAETKVTAAEARVVAAEAKVVAAEAKVVAAETRSRIAEQETATQRQAAEQAAAGLAAKVAELATAQAAAARLVTVEREVERLETELVVARGEVDGARAEVERRSTELKRRIGELEAANSKNEERVVKAYLKIKGDEKVRDKARKALAIALQLLEEGLPSEAPGEKRAPSQGTPRPVE
jgi:CheY-like chemotaxis protein